LGKKRREFRPQGGAPPGDLFDELQVEIHGPDWRARAAKGQSRSINPPGRGAAACEW
jgi:hypothetical protein